jgi:hypothetical protein
MGLDSAVPCSIAFPEIEVPVVPPLIGLVLSVVLSLARLDRLKILKSPRGFHSW